MRTQHYCGATLLALTMLAGCGGGAATDAQGALPCTLTSLAGCGGSLQPVTRVTPVAPIAPIAPADPATTAASVTLVFSSNDLASAGATGAEVVVTALVKTAQNTGVAGAKVDFSADSGLIAASSAMTDQTGKVTALLGTGGSKLNRPITVSAKAGVQSASGVVNVSGTRMALSGPAFLASGGSADLIATLTDSSERPIAGATLTATSLLGNLVQMPGKTSDSRGQVPLQLIASKRGAEQITLSALGASTTRSILVGGSDVSVTPAISVDASGVETPAEVAVGRCAPVGGSYIINGAGQAGSVTLSASRGTLYWDATCTMPLTGALALAGGIFPTAWIKSDNAGVSNIDANVKGGPSGSTRVQFVASLVASSRVDLQADLAVLGNGERSNLIAVVRDGTGANNLVKGATVQFSILVDPSGGNLLSPFSSVTGSDGIARAIFVAGPADTANKGTQILARIVALPSATSVANLTVSKKALSIQFGTGNQLAEFSASVLQKEFTVFVSDNAGNPVSGVTITSAAWPTRYKKGYYVIVSDIPNGIPPHWVTVDSYICLNEDSQRKGIYDIGLDWNNNGVLEPGIPLSVTAGGKTDAMGMTTVLLRYPRDRANWVQVGLTVAGTVSGTEWLARNTFWLPALAKDLSDPLVSPPGRISPYGTQSCGSAD
ncbi:MAG: Ig-like domain-containing protein [Massilia sp.]|nr:Ig-like domain-containing protein [Massilia sp.]